MRTFAEFMQYALYDPERGYYTSERKKIGKEGDFYTSPSLNPVFAEVVADAIAAMGHRTVIEFGAGEGRLARDMLARWQRDDISYLIVEISPSLREVQRHTLGELAAHVVWLTEEELLAQAPFDGIIVTNELVDAFPVHRITRTAEGLREIYVSETYEEQLGELSDPELAPYIQRYAPRLLVGQTVEVNLAGLAWYRRALDVLSSGHILTIDYGDTAEVVYHPSRMKGTLRGYYRHTVTDDPYQHIGEQDLTTDVNFCSLRDLGESVGWQTDFYGTQAQYLLQSGILQRLTDAWSPDPFRDPDMKRNRAIKSLILPGGLGEKFKVLVQSRDNRYNGRQ